MGSPPAASHRPRNGPTHSPTTRSLVHSQKTTLFMQSHAAYLAQDRRRSSGKNQERIQLPRIGARSLCQPWMNGNMHGRLLLLVTLCTLPGSAAFTATRVFGHRPAARRSAVSAWMQADGDPLASAFAKEAAKRAQQQAAQPSGSDKPATAADQPFTGIKEIVLDRDGKAMAIPRRPAPPPSTTQADEVKGLLQSPSFLFGSLVSVASLVLLLAIAQADANASL